MKTEVLASAWQPWRGIFVPLLWHHYHGIECKIEVWPFGFAKRFLGQGQKWWKIGQSRGQRDLFDFSMKFSNSELSGWRGRTAVRILEIEMHQLVWKTGNLDGRYSWKRNRLLPSFACWDLWKTIPTLTRWTGIFQDFKRSEDLTDLGFQLQFLAAKIFLEKDRVCPQGPHHVPRLDLQLRAILRLWQAVWSGCEKVDSRGIPGKRKWHERHEIQYVEQLESWGCFYAHGHPDAAWMLTLKPVRHPSM